MPRNRTPLLRRAQRRRDGKGPGHLRSHGGKGTAARGSVAAPRVKPQRHGMTPEQWNQVDELFHEALDMPHGERTAWVERISSDAEVRRELLSLLECDREAVGSVERKVKSAVTSMFEERAENR